MRLMLAAVAALTLAQPAAGQDARFPRAELVEGSFHQTVPPVRAFLATLKKLHEENAFDAGQGMEPRDDLGGLTAKEWLMRHVDPGFECRRDFGGICTSDDARVRFSYAFLSDIGWGSIGPDGPDPHSTAGLTALALGFRSVVKNIDLADGEGESCVPAIARTAPEVETAMRALLGTSDLLEAYDNFIGVFGRYRIRSAPSIDAPVVGGISNEAVFLPGPDETFTVYENDQALKWTYIVPAEGPAGFAALEDFDVVALSGVASPQLCVAMRDGQVMITAYAGAGD